MLSGAEILSVFHVCACVHRSGESHSSVQVNLREGQAGLRGSHEQVWLPVAGAAALRELPRAGRWTNLCGAERLQRSHRTAHCAWPRHQRLTLSTQWSFPMPGCSESAPTSEL